MCGTVYTTARNIDAVFVDIPQRSRLKTHLLVLLSDLCSV